MTSRSKIIFSILVVSLLGALYLGFPFIQDQATRIVGIIKNATSNQVEVEELREEVYSSPLRSDRNDSEAELSRAGTVYETNIRRQQFGLPELTEHEALRQAAVRKLQDLFERQYFEHISPDGKGPGYLAEQAGYDYIVVGENLALGNFKNDSALVEAWMNSPGHRANILSSRYTQIGVAVGEGVYKGSRVWIAVQEFGRPASVCPAINQALRNRIDSRREQSDKMSADLTERKKTLDAMPHKTREEQEQYNTYVAEYNALVKAYNELVAMLRSDIALYNDQVRAFNACVRR